MKKHKTIFSHHYLSPLGAMTMTSDGESLTGLWFDDCPPPFPKDADVKEKADLPAFRITSYWLDSYFAGRIPALNPPLTICDSEFRKMVWEQLLAIPYGQTTTYSDIARRIARRKGVERVSAQAVGAAVGHNPVLLIVPCHRVIGADGSMTGYSAGIDRKRRLLKMEKETNGKKK